MKISIQVNLTPEEYEDLMYSPHCRNGMPVSDLMRLAIQPYRIKTYQVGGETVTLTQAQESEIRFILRTDKILAIKLVRAFCDVGLRAAKLLVEEWAS